MSSCMLAICINYCFHHITGENTQHNLRYKLGLHYNFHSNMLLSTAKIILTSLGAFTVPKYFL